jgi:hypothetical protein
VLTFLLVGWPFVFKAFPRDAYSRRRIPFGMQVLLFASERPDVAATVP